MQNIPTYVYVLFFILLYIGIKRCSTRIIPISRLIIAPILFVFLSVNSALRLFGLQTNVFICLVLGGIVGIFLGYKLVHKQQVKINKAEHLIEIPGNAVMLFLVMSIFFIEFFIHYAVDANWAIMHYDAVKLAAMLISGMIAGISIGRNLSYYLRSKTASSRI